MIISILSKILEGQRHRLMLWVPVMFGVGVCIYFSLRTEPSTAQIFTTTFSGVILLFFVRLEHLVRSTLMVSILLALFGYSYAAYRTKLVEAPVLDRHYYGPLYGRIIGLDRSATNAPRVLMDQLYIPGFSKDRTPVRVRTSLQGYIPDNTLKAGARIALTTSISPPSPPAEPGGFDFRRMAWFMSLGGVGYTRNPVIPAFDDSEVDFTEKLFVFRMALSEKIKTSVQGQNGAFAAAIITGDRSDIDPNILESLRATNLAHLLAISGLHMGLLSGFVFALLRYGFALVPFVALRISAKKIAAGLAILAGVSYLMLSGASVATQRAFIMTSVVLFAVILDRPAFTLRAVSLAALLVLLVKPYSILEAGFQMSFAATTALISAYEFLNQKKVWKTLSRGRWKYLKPALAVIFTSGVAGLATGPISAFHFNQISHFGLIANLLAVPVMGLLVMPSAVLAFLLIPIGLENWAFFAMGTGIGHILWVAEYFSGLDGSVSQIKSGPPIVLAGIAIGGLILLLWQGKGRILGFVILLVTLSVWSMSSRPSFLIDDSGKMIGFMTTNGRTVNKPRGSGYAVKIWLENDGDEVTQVEAFERGGIANGKQFALVDIGNGWQVDLYSGNDVSVAEANCDRQTILILSKLDYSSKDCIVVDNTFLQYSGAVSIDMVNGIPKLKLSRDAARNRPWGY